MARRRVLASLVALASVALAASATADAAPKVLTLGPDHTTDQTRMFFPADGVEAAVGDEIAGEVLIDLKDSASADDVADLSRTYGIAVHANSAWSDDHDKFEVADVDPSSEDALIAKLAADPRVEHVERMTLLKASFVPDDPLYDSKQWHLKRVGAETAWDYTCGMGVTVAVIDTGVACFDKGPFMKGTDLSGTRCDGGYNFVDNSKEAYDDHGHGTHVAGTIAQTTNNGKGTAGLAYCATLMPIKVLSKRGFGTVANVAEGIRFAADNGAQVINMSLGGPIKSQVLEDAVNHAIKKGVIIVAAAGNSGKDVGYPAAYPGVIAVSATDANDKIAWFSSRGPEVAIAAPGVGVTQQTVCDGGKNKCEIFGTFSGTSMASPHVAGVAAMVVGMGVTDASSVRAALQSTAVAKDDPKLYGAGILNGASAVSRTHWWHVALRLAALAALFTFVSRRIRRLGGQVAKSKLAAFGAIVAAVGLLPFAPLLKLAPHVASFRPALELAMRPFGEWDLVWNASVHKWLVLASALPALALTMILFQTRLRRFVGGFALGSAALATQIALTGDVAFWAGSMMLRVWTIASALICLWIARIALDAKRT
jgi:serine protease